MASIDRSELPHNRFNPLKDEWILISPNRCQRPWSGATEQQQQRQQLLTTSAHVATITEDTLKQVSVTHLSNEQIRLNPLEPNGIRSNGSITPNYERTYVFTNDFPALFDYNLISARKSDADKAAIEKCCENDLEIEQNKNSSGSIRDNVIVDNSGSRSNDGGDDDGDELFCLRSAEGLCRVICYHPDKSKSLALMSIDEIVSVINTWISEQIELSGRYDWIQIFENKGKAMGCSNPHPHGQIWANKFLPNEASKENETQKLFYQNHGNSRTLLASYLKSELAKQERVVIAEQNWIVLVPFWACWPFETLLLPIRDSVRRINEITDQEKVSLAITLKRLLIKYDNLFQTSFPYSMGWHGAPTGDHLNKDQSHWLLHAHYYPPLLRSATIRKFMVGYELLAQPQRDLTPEKTAEMLRNVPDEVHYLHNLKNI